MFVIIIGLQMYTICIYRNKLSHDIWFIYKCTRNLYNNGNTPNTWAAHQMVQCCYIEAIWHVLENEYWYNWIFYLSNNACASKAHTNCSCYQYLFELLEEQLDILVHPTNPKDNTYLHFKLFRRHHSSSVIGCQWLSFIGSIKKVLKGG